MKRVFHVTILCTFACLGFASGSAVADPDDGLPSNGLFVTYVARDSTMDLFGTWSTDAQYWSLPVSLGDQSSQTAPAVVFFRERLYVFYVANNRLYVTSTSDGTYWVPSLQILDARPQGAPSVTEHRAGLFVFWSNEGDGIMHWSRSVNGVDWTLPEDMVIWQTVEPLRSQVPPAVTVFHDQLHVVYVDNDRLQVALGYGPDWHWWGYPVGTQKSWKTPSVGVFGDRLYIVYVAANSTNDILVTSSSDAINWTVQSGLGGQSSRTAPAMVSSTNALHVIYVANNDAYHLLHTSSSDGTHWSHDSMLGGQSSYNAPAAAKLGPRTYRIYLPLSGSW